MCGIGGIFGKGGTASQLHAMLGAIAHRGPDDAGTWADPLGSALFGQRRLSIIDLSPAGHQPMSDPEGRFWLSFNGEIYNYRELRAELAGYPFRGNSDSEVLLAAWQRWGPACLDRLIGMFAFLLWDTREQTLFAVRDRFGVKPLYYSYDAGGRLLLASEIKALQAAGAPVEPDARTWSTYLAMGHQDFSTATFWDGIDSVPPGHLLVWRDGQPLSIRKWYDLGDQADAPLDARSLAEVIEEYRALLVASVGLRFRSDVPVGINLSGGLDSSILLGIVQRLQGPESQLHAFTFVTNDDRYDELPWVRQMLAHTKHASVPCALAAAEVPELAESVQRFSDEPFGGIPTLAYARVFETARAMGTLVLLDGQGLDEQWAGYDYYAAAPRQDALAAIQGTQDRPVRPECLTGEFAALAAQPSFATPYPDALRNMQYRDIRYAKIPRALRFNDRVSMRSSTELREPFLDHRLVELAFRQPAEHKILNGTRKRLLREMAGSLLPPGLAHTPKRPLQTPQREWLRGPLREWAGTQIQAALDGFGGAWLEPRAVDQQWRRFLAGESDNSFYVWQWVSLGLMSTIRQGSALHV